MPHVAHETVTIQHERASRPRQVRISGNIRRAIDLMVHQGLKRADAAKEVGVVDETMRRALLQDHVLAYLNTQKGVLRSSVESRTLAKAEKLMDSAESEHVQMRAIEYISPNVSKAEITHTHQGAIPGLTLILQAPMMPGDDALQISDQPHAMERARLINSLPIPVPHPSMATRAGLEDTPSSKRADKSQ